MGGYSFQNYGWISLAVLLMAPSYVQQKTNFTLTTLKIQANRTSPAFSAIEDALSLKDKTSKLKPKTKNIVKPKIILKGIKLSKKRLRPAKVFALRGEKIGVKHFTDKFILNPEKLRLSAFKSNWSSPSSQTAKKSQILASSLKKKKSPALVLPSGIKLSIPNLEKHAEKENFVKPAQTSVVSLGSTSYRPKILKTVLTLEGADFSRGGDFKYYIERKLDGEVFETGVYSTVSNELDFEVGELKGFVSAELRTSDGSILAYGEKDLTAKNAASEFKMILSPTGGLFSGRSLDLKTSVSGKEKPIASTEHSVDSVEGFLEADSEGYFGEELFEKGSSLIASSHAKNYWSRADMVESGKALYPRLLKTSVVNSLSRSLDSFGERLEISSLVVGKATHMGLAKRGVQVRIFGQSYQKPVYLNEKGSPELKLKKTSKSGGFVFSNLEAGGHLVQVLKEGKVLSQRWFVVKEGHLSSGQIDVNKKAGVVAKVSFFPESMQRSPLVVKEVGAKQDFLLKEREEESEELKLITNPAVSVFKTQAFKDTEEHFYVRPTKISKSNFKVISKKWLNEFLSYKRDNRNFELGFVVGFVDDANFKVLKHRSSLFTKNSRIHYFDKNGTAVEEGLAGGGFVISNVSTGFNTLLVQKKSSDKFQSKIIYTQGNSVSLFD